MNRSADNLTTNYLNNVGADHPEGRTTEEDLITLEINTGSADTWRSPARGSIAKKFTNTDHWLVLGGCLSVLALVMVLDIQHERYVVLPFGKQRLPEICMFKRLTRAACPGCGLTRSFISLTRGDWAAAWKYNPAAFLLFPAIVLQIPYRSFQLWRHYRGLTPWGVTQPVLFCWVAVIVLLVQWLVKLIRDFII